MRALLIPLVLLVVQGPFLGAQHTVPAASLPAVGLAMAAFGREAVFDFGEDGMKFSAFIQEAREHTGLIFTFDRRQIDCSSQIINLRGEVRMPAAEVGRFVQEVLLAHDMLMMRMGRNDASIVQIVRLQNAQILKQRALPVAWDDIDGCMDRPAEVFGSVVPLAQVDCNQMARMLQNMIQEHRVSYVAPLPDANAVMICGTGRQMIGFADAIRRAETLAADDRAKAWRERSAPTGPGPRPAGH